MNHPFFILLATAAISCGFPVTLSFSAQGSGAGLGTSGGQELPVGSIVMIGTFDLTPAQVAASSEDHFTLLSSFHPLGSAVVGSFNGSPQNSAGAFASSVSVESTGNSGKRIYLWAFDAPTVGQASAHLVLSSPSWTVPSFGSVSCEVSQIPFSDSSTVAITKRQGDVTSQTLGGILNQAVALANPDGSDNDQDGIPALMEWATGSDPATPDATPVAFQNGLLTLPRFIGTSGDATDFSNNSVRYFIQVSENLKTWDVMDPAQVGSVSTTVHPTKAGFEILTLGLATGNPSARFWRLGVSRR